MHDPEKLKLFEILAKEHEPMLMAYILSLVSDRMLAEDIAQQCFLIAFRKISSLEKPESFPAWLRGIARLEVLSTVRKLKNEIPLEPKTVSALDDAFRAFESQEPAETWEERFKIVEECFERLPEALRQVCKLHYFEERKTRDIADQLQVGLNAVLKRLERARQAIRGCVEGQLKTEVLHG